MKILITGGTGFIGSRLAAMCLERNHFVRVLGQENNAVEKRNGRLIEERGGQVVLDSVTNAQKMREICQGMEWVFHLAAAQHEANVPDDHFRKVNVEGTRNLLIACGEAGVRKFVHGSTIGVYGAALKGSLDENSPLKPDNIYGETKLEAEGLVKSFSDKIPTVIIRISETYGPGDYRLLKLFKGIKKGFFFMIGNGTNLHHLIYIDDLNEGLLMAASSEEAVGKTLILAGKEAVTTNEMTSEISACFQKKIPRFRAPLLPFLMMAAMTEAVLRPLGIQPPLHRRRMDFFRKSFSFSARQAAETLGFSPKVSFSEGIKKTAAWYEEMGLL